MRSASIVKRLPLLFVLGVSRRKPTLNEPPAIDPSAQMYPLQDMHQQHVQFLPIQEAQRLLKMGMAISYGTRKRIVGIRLTVPLSAISEDVPTARPMTPAAYCGKRYILKEAVNTPTLRAYIWRLARLDVTESPEHALLRIVTAPALEAPYHCLRDKATEQERQNDPGNAKRKSQRNVFTLGRVEVPRRTRRNNGPAEVIRVPLRAPMKPTETQPISEPIAA
jgi:hypothetical protein